MTFTPMVSSGALNAALRVGADLANRALAQSNFQNRLDQVAYTNNAQKAVRDYGQRRVATPSTPRNPFQIPTQPTLPSMPTTVPTPTAGVAPIGTPGEPGAIYVGGGMMGDPFYYSRSPEEQSYIQSVLRANPGKRVPDLFNNGQYIGPSGNPPANGGGVSVSPPQLPSYQPVQDPYAPIDQLPTFNPNPTQPGTGTGGGDGGGQASGPFDFNTIDHADIPGVLKERGQIGLPGYQQLVDFGHTEEDLRKVFQALPDVARTPELNAYMRDNAMGILNTKGPFNLRTMDHGNIPDVLKEQGTLTQAGYNQLVEHGHPESLLRMTIRDAGIDVGNNLANYIDKNPMGILAQREFERGPVNPYEQEGLPSFGRGVPHANRALKSAMESAPFAFESNKMLKRGYSFTPSEGNVLISSALWTDDGGSSRMINIYGPANPQTGEGPGGPIDQTGNNPFGGTTLPPSDPPPPGIDPIYPVDPGPVDPGPGTGTPAPGTGGGGSSYNDQMADLLNRITDLATANPFADLPPYVAPPAPVYQAPNYTFNVPDPAAGPSYQMFGAKGSSVPGVKIKRSKAKRTLLNTLGTGFFNRSTRPTLRISNLNV